MVAERVLPNGEDAWDAVQNALVGIAEHIQTVPNHSEKVTRAYVLTAAKNAALNILKKRQRRSKFENLRWAEYYQEDMFQQVANSQDYALLVRAIRRLEPPCPLQAEEVNQLRPRYEYANLINFSLAISKEGTASISLVCSAVSSISAIYVTTHIEKLEGSSWVRVDTGTADDTWKVYTPNSYLARSCSIQLDSKGTYRAAAEIQVIVSASQTEFITVTSTAEYYEFNTHDVPCWFNHEKEKTEKDIMLDLIAQIVARLNEINDGSFVVEDLETERLKAL